MALQFYFGASGAGKSHTLYENIIARSMEEEDSNFIVIVPEQFTMQTQKELVMRHPRGGIMNIDVLSFPRLAYRIFEETGRTGRSLLDDMSKNLLLRRIASKHEQQLPVLGRNLKKLGYVAEIKSVISEFMQYGIGENEVEKLIEGLPDKPLLQYKLKEIGLLYKAFKEEIAEHFTTAEEMLEEAAGAAEQSLLLRKSIVLFDGFTGFTPIQHKFLEQLMVLSREVIITVLIDSRKSPFMDEGEQGLFHVSQKSVGALEKIAKEAGVARKKDVFLPDAPVYRYRKNPCLAHLERNLFRYGKQKPCQDTDSIHIKAAGNPMSELREVCITMRKLVREQGYRYSEMAVITGDMDSYAYFAREAFSRYEIPYFMDVTRGVLLNPFIEFIRASLEIVIRQYSYESVFRYLRTGLAGFTPEEIDCMENYVLALGIKGKAAWHGKWTRLYAGLTQDGLEQLDRLRERLAMQLAPLHARTKNAAERVTLLYEFIVHANMQQKMKRYELFFEEKGEPALSKEYAQIYKYVIDLLDKIAQLLGEEQMPLHEFAQLLDAGFAEARIGMIPPGPDRIIFGDMERTRLNHIKVLFFVGVNEGIIPKGGGGGGIISDMDRQVLREQAELAPSLRELSYRQRLYLYMNLTKPEERIYLSFAKTAGSGKALRPSYLITLLLGMYEGLSIEEQPEETAILTKEDGLDWLAANMHRQPEELFKQLCNYFGAKEQERERLSAMIQTAFYSYHPDKLSKSVSKLLYGQVLHNSVTRLERYAACAYAHFLEYGMKLKERQMYLFEQRDMGNVFHEALEQYAHLLEESPYTWSDIPREQAEQLLEQAIQTVVTGYGETVLYSTARNEYQIQRMQRILKRTVYALSEQVRKGMFVPGSFEVSFQSLGDYESVNIMLTDEERMQLKGRIDRLDLYDDEEHIYVKVIDYKSGMKKFDLAAVYYGLQLQLVVYMNVAVESMKRKEPDKTVVPAGILYYHIDDPLVEREENNMETISEKIMEQLKMNGLINDAPDIVKMFDKDMDKKSKVIPVGLNKDGSYSKSSSVASTKQLEQLSAFVTEKMRQTGKEILDGTISVNPYQENTASACDYCNFASVCGFDPKIAGFQKRQLKKYSRNEVMTLVSQSCGSGSEETDKEETE